MTDSDSQVFLFSQPSSEQLKQTRVDNPKWPEDRIWLKQYRHENRQSTWYEIVSDAFPTVMMFVAVPDWRYEWNW